MQKHLSSRQLKEESAHARERQRQKRSIISNNQCQFDCLCLSELGQERLSKIYFQSFRNYYTESSPFKMMHWHILFSKLYGKAYIIFLSIFSFLLTASCTYSKQADLSLLPKRIITFAQRYRSCGFSFPQSFLNMLSQIGRRESSLAMLSACSICFLNSEGQPIERYRQARFTMASSVGIILMDYLYFFIAQPVLRLFDSFRPSIFISFTILYFLYHSSRQALFRKESMFFSLPGTSLSGSAEELTTSFAFFRKAISYDNSLCFSTVYIYWNQYDKMGSCFMYSFSLLSTQALNACRKRVPSKDIRLSNIKNYYQSIKSKSIVIRWLCYNRYLWLMN